MIPSTDGTRAVLIGTYAGCEALGLADLPAVERNLDGLRRLLTDGTVWELPPEHCAVVAQPSYAHEVLPEVARAAESAADLLLVYYAGHGLLVGRDQELFLALSGASWEDDCLRYEALQRRIKEAGRRARRTVVILDCCYGGRALPGEMGAGRPSQEDLQRIVAARSSIDGVCVLTAAAATRKAISPPGEDHTAFTGELIAVLRDGVPGGPEFLDMTFVYEAVKRRLSHRPGAPEPQFGTRGLGGEIILTRNPAYTPGPPPHPVPYQATPDIERQALTMIALAQRARAEGDHRGAARHYHKALTLCEALANEHRQVNVLLALGQVAQIQGEPEAAALYHRRALSTAEKIRSTLGQANAWLGLAAVAASRDDHPAATDCYERALALARVLSNDLAQANALNGLGAVAAAQGKTGDSTDFHRRALELALRIRNRSAEANALIGLGNAALQMEEFSVAAMCYRAALEVAEALGNESAQADAHCSLADTARLGGNPSEAVDRYQRALSLALRTGDANLATYCQAHLGSRPS